MLYKYNFIKKHKMHKLNQHFLFFMRKIRNVSSTARFQPVQYFHFTFLNSSGLIAPHGRKNANLTQKFRAFFDTFKLLDSTLKAEFYDIILYSKDIHQYFEDVTKEVQILKGTNITRIIGDNSFQNLMSALWDSLKTNAWEIDAHYEEFFDNLLTKTCPFCGINQLPNPGSYRADYDHIAYKGSYPISAINSKNIAPSCADCNQKFKHQTDVFYEDDDLTRRPFIYPYLNHVDIDINFNGTVFPQTDMRNMSGTWVLNFIPNNALTVTWEKVYGIRHRYITEVLKVDYNTWLGHFKRELKDHNVTIDDYGKLKRYFGLHHERYNTDRLEKRHIVKSSLFKYFQDCNNTLFYDQVIREVN